jgi:hypothetical protein
MSKKPKRRIVPLDDLGGGELVESATKGTDLACALVAGAYIENATGNLLAKVLIPGAVSHGLLNNPLGILSTAGGRADMCYCLGLIDKTTYDNAKQIAKVRNQFAHSHTSIDFDNKEVKKLCESLTPPPLVDRTDKPVAAELAKRMLARQRPRLVTTALATFIYITVACVYSDGLNPVNHSVRCLLSEDASSPIGTVVSFNE